MALNLANYEKQARSAVKAFWEIGLLQEKSR